MSTENNSTQENQIVKDEEVTLKTEVKEESAAQAETVADADQQVEDDAEIDEDEYDEDELSEDEEAPETRTPEELLQLTRDAKDKQAYEDAVEYANRALSRKIEVSGFDNNTKHISLAEYYLSYGDALLMKEENSSELFNWDASKEGKSSSELAAAGDAAAAEAAAAAAGAEAADAEEEVDDLQLAWECLEVARLCFEPAIAAPPMEGQNESETDKITRQELVRQCTFASTRLADLLLLQENYEECLVEYTKSLNLRKAHGLRKQTLLVLALPRAQVLQALGKKEEAREAYLEAQEMVKALLAETDLTPAEKENYELTAKEVEDYIKSLDETVDEGAVEAGEFSSHMTTAKEAAAEAAAAVKERLKTGVEYEVTADGANSLGESKLTGEAAEVINVVASGSTTGADAATAEAEDGEAPKKKRRIVIA